ncbi:FtsW/RodA/SpoVE family cell cycle protein [Brevibacillus ruminantium]|uniref:FtsW/RodA/SpoVE family cell cycle protein n=1 Tax=Brevibacillus ruminantium TaxID=2950604 RepID=A0ABY4WGV2_9BACL|nr:FtsW/RodA/SpoVE family cell cycle protein [Brevibacillus ruminantium]USG65939.1 FtsW/RodA/SpoVE family cell cycle protein [Brevibacillus ruminantium]
MTPNDKIRAYLGKVCSQIRCKDVHADVKLELEGHIADKVEEMIKSGYSETEAVDQVLHEMGDPITVGKQLHQAHKPRIEWSVLGLVGILIGVGILVLFSLLESRAQELTQSPMGRHLPVAGLGVIVLIALLFANYNKIKPYSLFLYIGTILTMMYVFQAGTAVNGLPMLELPFTSLRLNFIRLSPIFLIISLAGIFTDWNWHKKKTPLVVLGLYIVPIFLFASAPDSFAALLYSVGFFVLLFYSPIGKKRAMMTISSLFGAAILAIALIIKRSELDRLLIFLHPDADPKGYGYALLQSIEALRSAGWWGNGFGASLDSLPALESDFAFVYLVHCFGLATGIGVLMIGIVLLVRLFRAANQTRDSYGALLIRGSIVLFFTPYFYAILMTMGWIPMFDASVPLISYGGANFLCNMALLGLVLGIYRRINLQSSVSHQTHS